MKAEVISTLFRWSLGVLFFAVAGWFLNKCADSGEISWLLMGVPFFLLGAIMFWKTIFHVATRPFLLLIDSIFFPGGKLAKPTLNLKLPAYYINQERYREALEEYTKILKHYPDTAEAYEKSIWLYLEIFDEPENAKKLARKAKGRKVTLDDRIIRHLEDQDRNPSELRS